MAPPWVRYSSSSRAILRDDSCRLLPLAPAALTRYARPAMNPGRGRFDVVQWAVAVLVVIACVAPLWWAALLPSEDLPVHLAYARIVRDHANAALPFGAEYTVASSA